MKIKFMSKNGAIVQFNVTPEEAEILLQLFSLIPDSEFIRRPYITR